MHELAFFLQSQAATAHLPLRHVMSKAAEVYFERLGGTREDYVGYYVEHLTRGNAWRFKSSYVEVDVRHAPSVIGLLRLLTFPYGNLDRDRVRQEYYKCAITALGKYAATLKTYEECCLLPLFGPNITLEQCLNVLTEFIAGPLRTFDFGATFPDAIMCFSVLQYIKYCALLDSDWKLVKITGKLYEEVLKALKEMTFFPLQIFMPVVSQGDDVSVQVMPQARKGRKAMNLAVRRLLDGSILVQTSNDDVKNEDDARMLVANLYHRKVLPLTS